MKVEYYKKSTNMEDWPAAMDWNGGKVIRSVDELLKQFGLEVLVLCDKKTKEFYSFNIVERKKTVSKRFTKERCGDCKIDCPYRGSNQSICSYG